MTAPVWITPPGDLGTVVEGEFYQVELTADNATSYSYLSGVLPVGIRITTNGIVEGSPKNYDYIQGVPTEVAKDVTSKFVVRATSTDGTVADRVFEMTVTGQDAPEIDSTPASDLGAYFDGDLVDVQLTVTDPDPGDTHTWRLLSGNIPDGVTVSDSGKIYGYIEPFVQIANTPGYDVSAYDMQPFDFRTVSENKIYEFTVEVSDGKDIDTKTYSLFAASRNIITADMDLVSADNVSSSVTSSTLASMLKADDSTLRSPAILTASGDIGTYTHDNYFNFQFVGKDFDGDTLEYLLTGTLPAGLTLDSASGYISGYIPNYAATTTAFAFTIQVRKKDQPEFLSTVVSYTMTVEGSVESTVTWPSATMTISTGEMSELSVSATISDGRPVQYTLKSGATGGNQLPQGLALNSSGLLVGRVSFKKMMFDTGSTTFDKDTGITGETTYESDYVFTARVFSTDGYVDTTKQFTITVTQQTTNPYDTLYARAHVEQNQRDIYDTLVQNIDDIPTNDVYRASDYNFGIRTDLRILINAGLYSVVESNYLSAMSKNFYNNTLRFGGFETAKVLNEDGTVRYEVVYVVMIDNQQGTNPTTNVSDSPALRQDLRSASTWENPLAVDSTWPKIDAGHYLTSQANNYYAYPNSIENMRSRLTSDIGHQILERKVLPDWMISKQDNGKSLGWILACPIVFCNPGTAEKIKYRLSQRSSLDLKKIDFTIDRFILDNNLSKNYNYSSGDFYATTEATFDASTTTWDGDGTRFYAGTTDKFTSLDDGDKYIKFPQTGVFR